MVLLKSRRLYLHHEQQRIRYTIIFKDAPLEHPLCWGQCLQVTLRLKLLTQM